ncbi:hypothetical protein JK358_20970 [Nocardia sp. 2]|uniref:UsfY protein n=1 Tax=Nocardia acididurans TaxID=2802282 RepID=A0ABS1M9Q4_9NOCA|nr:hypothetical protein [Nocardia acididurans]MBL1076870.1 hypothetical protein [Nocardia acididurans]
MTFSNPQSASALRRLRRTHNEFPDHHRTTRNHAGEGIEDGYNIPGIILCALAIIALAATLTAAGYGFEGWVLVGGIATVVLGGAGITWILLEHKRVKAKEGLNLTDQQGH